MSHFPPGTEGLGYEKHEVKGNNSGNSRNGTSSKIVKGEFGQTEILIPRDRTGTFEPQLIQKGQTRFNGFDDKILSMYARGLTTRDIQGQLQELYGVEVSPTLISNVTDAIPDEVKEWQTRPLDRIYPIIYFDALVVKIRVDKQVINKAIHLALGINLEGEKELPGMWCNITEGAKFWLSVLTELKNRVRLKNLWVKSVRIRGYKLKKLLTNGIISGMLNIVKGMSPIRAA